VSARSAARQYARALFEVTAPLDRTGSAGQDLAEMAALVAAHPDLRQALETPFVPANRKRALIEALVAAGGGMGDEVRRLLVLLADRDRLALLEGIADAFAEQVREAGQIASAEVVTAVPLTGEHEAALAAALGQATGRRVEIRATVDPAIVGGVVARVGSLVFDGSVVTQITRLRQQLMSDA
jgi:F-type H+-transporting ATPase subunit delta